MVRPPWKLFDPFTRDDGDNKIARLKSFVSWANVGLTNVDFCVTAHIKGK